MNQRQARMSVAIALASLLAIAGGASASGPDGGSQPPLVTAKRGDVVVPASRGSYCWKQSSSSEICVDYDYPLSVHKRLAVSPGDSVSLRVGARAARVQVSLERVAGEDFQSVARLTAKPTSPSRRRWTTRLPHDVKAGNVLDVHVEYPNNRGEADFWVGLRSGQGS